MPEISNQNKSTFSVVEVPKPIDKIKTENESDANSHTIINEHISNVVNSPNKKTKRRDVLTGPPYECEICGHGLPTKNALYQHRLRKHRRNEICHKNSQAFKCCLCSKGFSVIILLRQHLDTEHQSMGFVCEYCGHNLPTRNALCQHRHRKHRGRVVKHKTMTLKLKSGQNGELRNSQKCLNTNSKSQATSRKRVVNENDIWFKCDDCGHMLPTKNALCQHRLRKHRKRQDAKSYRCKYCEIVLTSYRA